MAGPSSTETVRLEQEMRESTTRSVQLLNEAFYVGTKTNEELDRQYESLERTETKLDEMQQGLHFSRRMLSVIRSPISALFSGSSYKKPYDAKVNGRCTQKVVSMESSDRKLQSGSSSLQNTSSSSSSSSTGDVVVDQNLATMSKVLHQLRGVAELTSQQLDDSDLQIERILGKTKNNDGKLKELNKSMKKELQS